MRVACIVVRTDTGPNESFKVNVGLHQMSVLLFSVVMDIDVLRKKRSTPLFVGLISSDGTNDGGTV